MLWTPKEGLFVPLGYGEGSCVTVGAHSNCDYLVSLAPSPHTAPPPACLTMTYAAEGQIFEARFRADNGEGLLR